MNQRQKKDCYKIIHKFQLFLVIIYSFWNLMRNFIGRFLKQYLIILCINQMASSLFRMMAALGRDVIVANTVGAFALLVVLVLGGFVISRGTKL